MARKNLFSECRRLRRQGRVEEALARLKDALRRRALDAEEVFQAGRFISKSRDPLETELENPQVLILGQCTTSWIVPALTAVAWGDGATIEVEEGGYDNIIQDLAALDDPPAIIVLVPWHQRLLNGADGSPKIRLQDEIDFWDQAWGLVVGKLGTRLLQVGHDWVGPGAMGHFLSATGNGDVSFVRRANQALRKHLPKGALFVDLEQVSGVMGRERFYDPRRYFWTKQPFSEAGTVRLAEHMWAGIRAMLTGPKKVLVLDLDDTLWGGVVGETGPFGVDLGQTPAGEAYRDFQEHVKDLGRRGCLLAVCSKNNPEDAREPFEKNRDMVLSLSDFAVFEASWESKADVIERIADTLGLGLDTFVFFDDNPSERELIRQTLPEVEVVEVPEDPSEYKRALQSGHWFDAAQLTDEDRLRTGSYRDESHRRKARSSFRSLDDYLISLTMTADAYSIDEGDFDRVVQLIGKTNQFNLTTRRHNADDVRAMLASSESVGIAMRMTDRFGDYGLISVILAVEERDQPEKTLRIDTWLMSCRVIGRTAEQFFFNSLVDRARELGYSRLVGEYIPTKKNTLVCDLFEKLGFTARDDAKNELIRYYLSVDNTQPAETFVRTRSARR